MRKSGVLILTRGRGNALPPLPHTPLRPNSGNPPEVRVMAIPISVLLLAVVILVLAVLNVYQFLIQRSALRIADILYIMSCNIRQRASEVRRHQKDVEILEAHLFDIATSARSLLKALGRSNEALGPDPAIDMPFNGRGMDADSLLRLADNVFYAVAESSPDLDWEGAVNAALDRFVKKVPKLDREGAEKIMSAVAQEYQRAPDGRVTLPNLQVAQTN